MKAKKVAFTGGGSGGHVYPAIAIIQQLKKKQADLSFVWIGQKNGVEKSIVEKYNLPYRGIAAGKLRRYFSIQNFFDIFKVIAGFFQALVVLLQEKPSLVFSKGGFVTVPVVWAAALLKIPVFIHESDSDSGLANRLSCFMANRIFVPYQETIATFPACVRKKIVVSGNPIREHFFNAQAEKARARFHLTPHQPFILVLGGSLGSTQVNNLVQDLVPSLPKDCFILHQMGDKLYQKSDNPMYVTVPFIQDELPDCIAASTLVISRSGAGSVWELGLLQAVPIFIPLGQRGDQVRNAALIQKRGACISLPGDSATIQNLQQAVSDLLTDSTKLLRMKEAMKGVVHGQAADILAEQILAKVNANNVVI